MTRSFYFSYSYDITQTLQHNIIRQREALGKGLAHPDNHDYNDMFAWNHYLLGPAKLHMKNTYDWCMPIVHGYVDQSGNNCPFSRGHRVLLIRVTSAISVYGRIIYITVIARRSRYFAGARFLKRGANDLVAFSRYSFNTRANLRACIGICCKRRGDRTNCFRDANNFIPRSRKESLLQPELHILCAAPRKYPIVLDAEKRCSHAQASSGEYVPIQCPSE